VQHKCFVHSHRIKIVSERARSTKQNLLSNSMKIKELIRKNELFLSFRKREFAGQSFTYIRVTTISTLYFFIQFTLPLLHEEILCILYGFHKQKGFYAEHILLLHE